MAEKQHPDHRILEPEVHATHGQPGPRDQAEQAPREERQARGCTAVLAIHGMGQQIPFSTLHDVVQGLYQVEGLEGREPEVGVGNVAVGEDRLRRAELTVGPEDNQREVHVYEAYWAPLTEGQVRLRDVLVFLLHGGLRGLQNAFSTDRFKRWLFGTPVAFPKNTRSAWQLVLASWLFLSLVAMDVIVTGALAPAAILPAPVDPKLLDDLVVIVAGFTLPALLFGASLALPVHRSQASRGRWAWLPGSLWWVTLAAWTLALPILLVAAAHHTTPFEASLLVDQLPALATWTHLAVLGGLFVISLAARRWLISHLGDVAVYVQSHRLDRFAELRGKIKDRVAGQAEAIYQASRSGGQGFQYDEVAIVGHSLGSVVAYDTINGAINRDVLRPEDERLDVQGRTGMLLTFGSPLDKTAFVFGTHPDEFQPTREALAGLVQPLILDPKYRTFPWVNVHAGADPISGALDLYGPTADEDLQALPDGFQPVENVKDEHASTPVLAHTQYWGNNTVWCQLRDGILGRDPRGCDPQASKEPREPTSMPTR